MNNNNGFITSSPSTYSVTWMVHNNKDFPVRIQWVNFEGRIENEGFVVPAKSSVRPGTTYVGHVFFVTNENETDQDKYFVSAINVMGAETTIG